MSDTERRILDTFGRVVPRLPKEGQEKLLALGEGIAIGAGVMKLEESSTLRKEDTDEEKSARPA